MIADRWSEEVVEVCEAVVEVVLDGSCANDMLEDTRIRNKSRRSLDCVLELPIGLWVAGARSIACVAREKVGGSGRFGRPGLGCHRGN